MDIFNQSLTISDKKRVTSSVSFCSCSCFFSSLDLSYAKVPPKKTYCSSKLILNLPSLENERNRGWLLCDVEVLVVELELDDLIALKLLAILLQ
jgi:hypothetical protein